MNFLKKQIHGMLSVSLMEDSGTVRTEEAPARQEHRWWYLLSLSGFWLGVQASNAALQIILVANRVRVMFPRAEMRGTRSIVLGAIQSVAGLAAGVVFPILGAKSDRHSSRAGRRTPFMLGGSGLALVFFVALAVSGQLLEAGAAGPFAAFVVAVMGINVAIGFVSAPYTALLPDMVSPAQLGAASGWMGLMAMLGNAVGGSVLGLLVAPLESAFGKDRYFAPWCVILGLLFAVTLAWTVLVVREKPHFAPSQEPVVAEDHSGRSVLARHWLKFKRVIVSAWRSFLSPFRSRDFLWVFWTKFLMVCGVNATSGYLVYWIADCFPRTAFCDVAGESVVVLFCVVLFFLSWRLVPFSFFDRSFPALF